jgi:transcriptional regulator with XRE-family HTH domain
MQKTQREMTATWLREGRVSRGLTQKELSEQSRISVRSIQRIENGELIPRSHTIKTLAETLGLSFDEFMAAARKQQIVIKENEDTEVTISSVSKTQRVILSVGVCFMILFLAVAYAIQAAPFPETTFESLLYSAFVIGVMTVALFFIWRRKS